MRREREELSSRVSFAIYLLCICQRCCHRQLKQVKATVHFYIQSIGFFLGEKKTLRSTLYALPFIFLLTLSSFSDLGFPKIKKLYTLCTRAFSLSSYLNPCNKNYKLLCYLIYFYYYSCIILYFLSITCTILINLYFYLLYFQS